MFGFIYVNEQELKLREFTTYRSFYCGLCQELHRRYGKRAQLILNYDMTFLAIMMTGLYEPESVEDERRCLLHPVRKHKMMENDAIGYAADMSVLLAYQKGMDDWEDEHKVSSRTLAGLLHSGYNKISEQYPRQTKAVEENIRLLHEAERAQSEDIDYVAGLTGNFYAEVFVWKDDIWQEDLRQIGFYLGKFIYLMDAVADVDNDKKHDNYNILKNDGDIWEGDQKKEIYDILVSMMAEASRAFERLPVLEYAPIIRNILYSGVWCGYKGVESKDTKQKEKLKKKEK